MPHKDQIHGRNVVVSMLDCPIQSASNHDFHSLLMELMRPIHVFLLERWCWWNCSPKNMTRLECPTAISFLCWSSMVHMGLMVDDGLMTVDDGWWWLTSLKKTGFITHGTIVTLTINPIQPSYLQQLRNINQLYINHKLRTNPHFCWLNFLFVGKIYLWAPFGSWSRKQRWNLPGRNPTMQLFCDGGRRHLNVPHF